MFSSFAMMYPQSFVPAAIGLLKRIAGLVLVLPLTALIVVALWLAAQGTYESMRFNSATQQILGVVSTAHDFAARQPDFATLPGVDLLGVLSRAGQITAVDDNGTTKLLNPWGGPVHGSVSAPSIFRIVTGVPARDCRRLALFFAGAAADLGLVGMETQANQGSSWTLFYKDTDAGAPRPDTVEAACGQQPEVMLALSFRVR